MLHSHSDLIAHIARKNWWHVSPHDPRAYSLRGTFYASTYREAEFYGRPEDTPTRVRVANPLVGDEAAILAALFPDQVRLGDLEGKEGLALIEARHLLDSAMMEQAIESGHDAIVLMTPSGHEDYMTSGKIPRSIELNVFTESQRQAFRYVLVRGNSTRKRVSLRGCSAGTRACG